MDPASPDLVLESVSSDTAATTAEVGRVVAADGRADDVLLPALAACAAGSRLAHDTDVKQSHEAQIAKLKRAVTDLLSAATAGHAEKVAAAEAQGMALLVSLLSASRAATVASRAQAAKASADLHDASGSMHLAARQELLHRYRSLITDNAQASTALLDTGASDPEGSFRSSMTQAERTMLQSAADPDHVTNVLRLLHERQQRRALHQELLKLRADQQEARVALARKAKVLRALDQGAQALAQAATAPCDELSVAEALTAVDVSAVGTNVELPGPLYVLASELQSVQQVYALPIQVEADDSTVSVTVGGAASEQNFRLDFSYHEGMHAVLAKCSVAKGDDVLQRLQKDDDGTQWPHDVNRAMQSGERAPAIEPSQGRPYRWCQSLAGLDRFLAPPAEMGEDATDEDWFAWRRQQRAVEIVRNLQRASTST